LLNKIEEYQNSNKEWEIKVGGIKSLLSRFEEKNNSLKEENEFLIDKLSELEFHFKITKEKEKTVQATFGELQQFQIKYEDTIKEFQLKKKELIDKEDTYRLEINDLKNLLFEYEKNLEQVKYINLFKIASKRECSL
jgi:chromosome segregation ATPase